ncbi:MAG: guanine deaminase [Gammaproteobacteria bacterium]|nr:guanine deaminase [Gammaproteobacteria bacterium]
MSLTAHRGEILHFLNDPTNTVRMDADDTNVTDCWHYFKDGLLVLEAGYVRNCGASADLLKTLPTGTPIIEHRHGLIMPGFVDAHVHYPQCEVIGAYDTQLLDWLETHTFPAELKFSDQQYGEEIAAFFIDQLLSNGTTTALVFGTVHPESVDAFFTVAERRKLRMICGKVMMDRHAPKALCDTPASSYQQSRDLIRRWHGRSRLSYAVTPRFAPTSSPEQLDMAGRLMREFPDVYLQTHLSENLKECEWVSTLFPEQKDYLDVYDHHGLLGRRSVFAHGIHLSDDEWQRLHQTDSSIAFCPTSNLFIGSGLFRLDKADEYHVSVGLGTDVGGGDSFSILRTINEAYKVQQLQGDNLSPFRALYLATLGGAKSLNLESVIGNFESGKEADFVVLDYQATKLLDFRIKKCKSIMERLFVLQMLGDDRAIRETWIMGEKQILD